MRIRWLSKMIIDQTFNLHQIKLTWNNQVYLIMFVIHSIVGWSIGPKTRPNTNELTTTIDRSEKIAGQFFNTCYHFFLLFPFNLLSIPFCPTCYLFAHGYTMFSLLSLNQCCLWPLLGFRVSSDRKKQKCLDQEIQNVTFHCLLD